MKNVLRLVLSAAALSVSGWAQAEAAFTDFASYTLGQLPGGADARTAGNHNQWWVPDNAATFGEVRDGIGLLGGRGLVIGNRGNGNDGVVDNVKTGRLAQSAGESTTLAPHRVFESSYWFRTVNTTATTDYRLRTETYGTDRTTFLGFQNDGFGNLSSTAFDIDATGNFTSHAVASSLNWGEWYRVVTEVVFVDGSTNDIVNHRIFDGSNVLVGSALGIGTWEQGQRVSGYNGGNLVAPDAVQFQARRSCSGSCSPLTSGKYDVAYVDDLGWRTFSQDVPEPGTLALAGLALAFAVASRRRRN